MNKTIKPGNFYLFGDLKLCLTTTPIFNFNVTKIHYLSSKGTVGTDVFGNDFLGLIKTL
jgi:hypothetical protein